MIADDTMLGIQKQDPKALKPLKVRLPLEHVLQLHRMRIMGSQTVSEIVADALEGYLAGLYQTQRKKEPQERVER